MIFSLNQGKHSFLLSSISVCIFAIIFGYFIVFSGNAAFSDETGISFSLSNNIYTDSSTLNKSKIIFKTSDDIQNYTIVSECNIFTQLLEDNDNLHLFEIKFLDNSCTSERILFVNKKSGETFSQEYNILSEYDIYGKLLDYDTERLFELKTAILRKIQQYSFVGKNDFYKELGRKRVLEELNYTKQMVEHILEKRQDKYILPVEGRLLENDVSKIPNAGRPYRSDYTDGVHHGWDINGAFGEPVISVDDGIIVRIVSGFQFSDLGKIKRGAPLIYEDKLKNLDILRGNQVWLKTMKGDIVMYSHLNEIFGGIQVGSVVHTGQRLGAIGITGVPDKNYTDYHLHFAIHKNPYNVMEAGKYTLLDYMKWDWYFKGNNLAQVLENQKTFFKPEPAITVKKIHEKEG